MRLLGRAGWFCVGAYLLLTFGCATTIPLGAGSPAPRTGQEQAVHVIWTETYGRTDRPPKVRWMEGDRLSCVDPESGKTGFPIATAYPDDEGQHAVCREGDTWSPLEILVAWHGETSFSETTLAHELLHAAKLREGDFRDQHQLPEFDALVGKANDALVKAGL